MKMEEPFFIVNDYVEENRKELEKIINIVNPEKIKDYEKARFLRNLTNEMFKAYTRTRKFTNKIKEKEEKINVKKELEKKKLELLQKLKQLEIENKIKKQTPEEVSDIILSRFSNKPLAIAKFDGYRYIITEPELKEVYLRVINELKDNKGYYNIENFRTKTKEVCRKLNIQYTDELMDITRYYLIRDIDNFGIISVALEDERVNEIICDGSKKPVHITYKDKQDIVTNITYKTNDEISKIIEKIALKSGIKPTQENPFITLEKDRWKFQGNLKTEFIEPKFIFARIS